MNLRKNSNHFHIITVLTSLTLYFLIVGFIMHLFVATTRNDIIAIGEKTTLAAVNEVNQFLKENIDVVEIESDGVEFLLSKGVSLAEIEDFLVMSTSDYENEVDSSFTGFYGWIKGEYLDGTGWVPDEGYDAKTRLWYQAAVKGNGASVIAPPYDDIFSGEIRISAARLLKDKESAVAVDISLAKLVSLVNEIKSEGYGDCVILDEVGDVVASSKNDIRLNYLTGGAGEDMKKLAEKIYDEGLTRFNEKIDGVDYYVFSDEIYGGWRSLFFMPKRFLYKDMLRNMCIAATASLILMALLLFFCNYSNRKRKAAEETITQINAVSSIYASMSEIDLNERTFKHIYSLPHISAVLGSGGKDADEMFKKIMHTTVVEEYIDSIDEFTNLSTLGEKFKYTSTNTLTHEFMGKILGWCRARFIVIDYNADHTPHRLLFAVEDINEAKKEEERLVSESTVDKLTGCFNRKAYEETISHYNENPMEDDLVYFSMDVNELKAVNDDLGHAVGDELIKGLADCMKQTLRPYGKVYRTGGDEFFALINVERNFIDGIVDELRLRIRNWHGKTLESGSASIGYASHAAYPELSIKELAKIADQFMYADKERFYRRKGIDRRGQKEAYSAICSLYTKILLVSLTDNSFQTVHMNSSEQTEECGYSDTYSFSEWANAFCDAGFVQDEFKDTFLSTLDIESLKAYFDAGNKPLKFRYKRKIDGEFKQVGMEIAPSPKYSDTNQLVYLYIKVID